jgi:hypothetical protein
MNTSPELLAQLPRAERHAPENIELVQRMTPAQFQRYLNALHAAPIEQPALRVGSAKVGTETGS